MRIRTVILFGNDLRAGIFGLLASLLVSCASGESIPPPGGPPDTEPPIIVESVPVDGSLNFGEREIEITFNEYLQEGRETEHIVITPIPDRPPEYDWSGKTLEIKFREALVKDRTYAVTVGAGMSDLSGNRLGTPYTLRFSTGNVIDSGRIAGQLTGVGDRTAFMFGYLLPDDVATFTDTLRPDSTMPDFIAPVGDDGSFSMEGLPPGRYRLVGVVDEFADRLYSPGTDAYGVAAEDVTVPDDYAPVYGIRVRLLPAPIDMRRPQLLSAVGLNRTTTELRFSEPIDTSTIAIDGIQLQVDGSDHPIRRVWRSAANELNVLLSHAALPAGGSANVSVSGMADSIGQIISDTSRSATFTVPSKADTTAPALIPPKEIAGSFRMTDTVRIAFNEAVDFNEASDVVILRDTAESKQTSLNLVRRAPDRFVAIARDTTFDAIGPLLMVDLSAFTDLAGNRTDSVWNMRVRLDPIPQRGALEGTLTDSLAPNVPHVIVLESADQGYHFTVKLAGTGPWRLKEVPSGNYLLSAFRDTDGDGEYDYGSLKPFRPGEVFVERPGGIRVRPRWTTKDVDLKF